MLKLNAVEMRIMREIGDFPHGIGKPFIKTSRLFRISTAFLFPLNK